jgi:hypothetical protein
MTTEPPFPARQAVKQQRRAATTQPKIINGVSYFGGSGQKEPAPPVAKHALMLEHQEGRKK